MKIFLTFIITVLSLSACISPGNNSKMTNIKKGAFPTLTGIDLLGDIREVPTSLSGKLNLIVIGFEREHQKHINSWIAIADKINAKYPNFRFYEIPLIHEMNPAYRTWINNGMRAGIKEPIARESTITIYTDRDKFTNYMNMDTSNIYSLLLDRDGQVLWRSKGAATQELIKELNNRVETYENTN